jgi:hypothetical protein
MGGAVETIHFIDVPPCKVTQRLNRDAVGLKIQLRAQRPERFVLLPRLDVTFIEKTIFVCADRLIEDAR